MGWRRSTDFCWTHSEGLKGKGGTHPAGLESSGLPDGQGKKVGAGKQKESHSLEMWGGFILSLWLCLLAALAKAAIGVGGAEQSSS